MKNKNRALLIGLYTAILLVVVFVGSFAWWQMTQRQTDVNKITAACLKFKMESAGEGLSLNGEWPIPIKEGYKKDSYVFTVTNECNEPLNYIIALEEIKKSNYPNDESYINGNYVDITIDNHPPKAFSSYDDIVDDEDDEQTIMDTRKLKSVWIKPNGTNTHSIKMWLDEKMPIEENKKIFNSKIRVTGGQKLENEKLTPESCFTISEEGKITNFDYENCNTNVVIPPTINGIQVKSIIFPRATAAAITSVDLTKAYYLESIDSQGFQGFVGEGTELIIPGNVTLNNASFSSFKGSNLIIEDGVTELPRGCFNNYYGTDTVLHIPSTVKYIDGFFAFVGNSITFNEGLEEIDGSAFDKFNGPGPIVIPSTVTTIGVGAFDSYTGTVIIKNTEGNVTFDEDLTFRHAEVIYDPNYGE